MSVSDNIATMTPAIPLNCDQCDKTFPSLVMKRKLGVK